MNKKAIAVYLDDSDKMEVEFSWLYKTWILYSLESEYDLVVYYNPDAANRIGKFQNEKELVAIAMEPMENTKGYPFLNSHNFCLAPHNSHLFEYEYIMKTDCDVFLTNNMRGLVPSKIMVGYGGYADTSSCENHKNHYDAMTRFVDWIIQNKKLPPNITNPLPYRGLTNIGASFYGKTEKIIPIVCSQVYYTDLLRTKEGVDIFWKHYYNKNIGISSMIAGEVVFNLTLTKQHYVGYVLDSFCWPHVKFGNDICHIHAWHSPIKWSKLSFFREEYDDWEVNFVDAFDNTANYCHWIATTPIGEIRKFRNIFKHNI